MQIRKATLEDAAEIARLTAQLGYPTPEAEIEQRLRRLVPNPEHCILVADDGTRLLGFGALERRLILEMGEHFELVGLAVDQSGRRQGVATALIAAGEAWVAAVGGGTLFLRSNVVRPEAHEFYPRRGYSLSKTQHVYVKSV